MRIRRIEKQQNILYAMGINENGEGDVKFVSTDIAGSKFKNILTTIGDSGEHVTPEDDQAYLID